MQLIKRSGIRLLLADEGKHIRSINDIYIPEHYEDDELIPEHTPIYSEMIFLGSQIDENDIDKIYIEESK